MGDRRARVWMRVHARRWALGDGVGERTVGVLSLRRVRATLEFILHSFFIYSSFIPYALSWMKFWGRDTLFALIVASLVVPLQMCLIPLLSIYNDVGALFNIGAKSYPGIWMAHTGFGIASTTFLLTNFIKKAQTLD